MTGPRVALVKSAGRADMFAAAIQGAGGTPVLVSPYRREPVPGFGNALRLAFADAPDWIAVTSPNAVPALEAAPPPRNTPVAAVGPGTATSLQSVGVIPALVGPSGGAALAVRLAQAGAGPGARVVHVCGEEARPELAEGLEAAGVEVLAVPVYRMVPDPVGERSAAGDFAAVVVGSPRLAVRAAELFPGRPRAVAIGRTTAAALRDLGWPPATVAAGSSPEDVAAALAPVLRGASPGTRPEDDS